MDTKPPTESTDQQPTDPSTPPSVFQPFQDLWWPGSNHGCIVPIIIVVAAIVAACHIVH